MKGRINKNHVINKNHLLRIALPALVVALLASTVIALKSNSSASAAPTGSEIVARVEGHQITAKIYRMYLKNGIEALGLSDKTEQGRDSIDKLKEGIIAELVDRALIQQEVARRNISISQERFDAAYKKRVEEMGGDESYQAYLAEHAITDLDFRQVVNQEVYGAELQQELGREVSLGSEDARAFYETEKANPQFANIFREDERVRASHILIAARRASIAARLRSKGNLSKTELDRQVDSEMSKLRKRAALALGKAKAGADFAALAREFSDDPGTKDRGGDLGIFSRNTHTAKFDEAAFALEPGRISNLVETEYGFHIIKVAERRPQRTRNFDEARTAVEQHLLRRKRAAHLNAWLESRRAEADIQVEPSYRVGQYLAGNR